jgi:hypothetical protein
MNMKFKEINSGSIFCKQSKKFDNVKIEIIKSGNYYLKKRKSSTMIRGKGE